MLTNLIPFRKFTTTLLAALICAVSFSSFAFAEDRVPGDKVLPKKVFAVATIHNIKETVKRYKSTGLSKLVMSRQMADFRDEVINAIADPLVEMENKFGATLNDLVEMTNGEITVALFQPPRSSLDIAVLVDLGENRIGLDAILEKMSDQFSEWNAEHEVKQIEGVDVEVFDFSGQGDEKLQRIFTEMKVLYFIKDNRLVMSSSEAAVESMLQRWDGQHKRTLFSNDYYQAILKKCSEPKNPRTPMLSIYANPVGLMQFITSKAGNMESGILLGMLPTLGITQIKAVGGTVDMGTEEFEVVSNTYYLIDQPVKGVLRAFTAPSTDQTPPSWVSKNTDLYQAMNWDVEKAFKAVSSVVDIAFGPGGTMQYLDQLADNELGFHLKTDLLDNLAGTFHIDSKEVDDENSSQSFRFVAEVKDPKTFSTLIQSFAELPGSEMTKRDFQGVTIYEYDNGEDEEGAPSLFSVAVVGNLAMMGTPPRLIEQAIRGNNDEPLNKSASYKAVAKFFPEKTAIRVFQSKKYGFNLLKDPYEEFRKGEVDLSEVEMEDDVREIIEKIDFTKLPAFETLMSYLTDSGVYVVPSDDGVLQKQFFLKAKSE